MLRSEITQLRNYLWDEKIKKILRQMPIWRWNFNEITSSVWWIITWSRYKNWDFKDELNKKQVVSLCRFLVNEFSKKQILEITRNTKKSVWELIKENLDKKYDTILLEYIIVEAILKAKKYNKVDYVIKWDRILDFDLATDFTFCARWLNNEPIKFWTQLTVMKIEKREEKIRKMLDLKRKLESWVLDEKINDLSVKVRPDILCVLSLNWPISSEIWSWIKSLRKAFNNWKETDYSKNWIEPHISENINEEIFLLNNYLPIIIQTYLASLKYSLNNAQTEEIIFERKSYFIEITKDTRNDVYSVVFYKKVFEWEKKFIFSLDFTKSWYKWSKINY